MVFEKLHKWNEERKTRNKIRRTKSEILERMSWARHCGGHNYQTAAEKAETIGRNYLASRLYAKGGKYGDALRLAQVDGSLESLTNRLKSYFKKDVSVLLEQVQRYANTDWSKFWIYRRRQDGEWGYASEAELLRYQKEQEEYLEKRSNDVLNNFTSLKKYGIDITNILSSLDSSESKNKQSLIELSKTALNSDLNFCKLVNESSVNIFGMRYIDSNRIKF